MPRFTFFITAILSAFYCFGPGVSFRCLLAEQDAAADTMKSALSSVACDKLFMKKMHPILRLERRAKQSSLSYGQYSRLTDQIDFFWEDAYPYFLSLLQKEKVSKAEFERLVQGRAEFLELALASSQLARHQCPVGKTGESTKDTVFSAFVSISDFVVRLKTDKSSRMK